MMYRKKSWPEQHPILLALGVLFGLSAVIAYWPLFLGLAVLAGIVYGVLVWAKRYDRKQHEKWEIANRGAYEHHLWMQGDPRGTFGRYPPAV